MKKILYALFYGLLAVIVIGAVTNIKRENHVTEPNEYSIEYVGVYDGKEERIDDFLFLESGSYPTSYTFGEGAVVSDLRGKMTKTVIGGQTCYVGTEVSDPKDYCKEYGFYGWYFDAACTQEFDGEIGARRTGHITLYAKISVSWWTAMY